MKSFEESIMPIIQGAKDQGFMAGQQSKQAEVDELRFQRDVLSNKVDELQRKLDTEKSLRSMSEHLNSTKQSEVDELRKRIDAVVEYLDGCDSCCDISKLHLIEVLQGDQS